MAHEKAEMDELHLPRLGLLDRAMWLLLHVHCDETAGKDELHLLFHEQKLQDGGIVCRPAVTSHEPMLQVGRPCVCHPSVEREQKGW